MRLEYRGIAPFNDDAAEWNCQIQCLRVWTEDVNKVALHIEPDVHAGWGVLTPRKSSRNPPA